MIIIIDSGSQYSHLIKRGCRDLDYEAELVNAKLPFSDVEEKLPSAEKIILSGGPSSVSKEPEDSSLSITSRRTISGEITMPVLGICYGHQMLAYVAGAKVEKGASAEYGVSEINIEKEDLLFKGVPKRFRAWVSHFDQVKTLPEGFEKLASSEVCEIEAMRHLKRHIYGVQFHPEVWHTEHGEKILSNFLGIR